MTFRLVSGCYSNKAKPKLAFGHSFNPFSIKRRFLFRVELPWTTPSTVGRNPVWLRTGLDIDMALDPTDEESANNGFVSAAPN